MKTLREIAARRVKLETLAGPERNVGTFTITPVARTLTVSCALGEGTGSETGRGGLAFARTWPSAVLVSNGAQTSRLRIIDLTRVAQVVILLGATLWVYEVWRGTRARKE
jgi:hypothetical protein